MIKYAILFLAAVAGASAYVTSTGVDLTAVIAMLDSDANGGISNTELETLTMMGDMDGDGEVTAAEFEETWKTLADSLGIPANKHSKYFALVDGVDGSADDGKITQHENDVLFTKFDKDGSGLVSEAEFGSTIDGVLA